MITQRQCEDRSARDLRLFRADGVRHNHRYPASRPLSWRRLRLKSGDGSATAGADGAGRSVPYERDSRGRPGHGLMARAAEPSDRRVVGAACRFPAPATLPSSGRYCDPGQGVGYARGTLGRRRQFPRQIRPGKMYTRGGFITDIESSTWVLASPTRSQAHRPAAAHPARADLGCNGERRLGRRGSRDQDRRLCRHLFSGYAALQPRTRSRRPYVMSGSAVSRAASRICYFSAARGALRRHRLLSSLVAVHEACVSVARQSVCDAGHQRPVIALRVHQLLEAHAVADQPLPRLDASGDGYVRSRVAVGAAEALAQAADGDPIWAVASSGVNSDGRTTGLACDPVAQEALLRHVYSEAGIDPASVSTSRRTARTSVGIGQIRVAMCWRRPAGDCLMVRSRPISHLEPALVSPD